MKKNFVLMILIAAFFAFGCDLVNKSQSASNDISNLEAATPTPDSSKKPEPTPAPKVERDLLSFAEGTIIVQPAFEYLSAPAFGPIALIDSTTTINWVSESDYGSCENRFCVRFGDARKSCL